MSPYLLELAALMAVFSFVIVVPGADLAVVMRQSMVHGRRAAIWTSVGIGTALLFHIGYTILGLGLVVSQSVFAFTVVKYAGAAYLFWLGWRSLRDAAMPDLPDPQTGTAEGRPATDEPASERDRGLAGRAMSGPKAFALGFATNALNPKAVVFFLSLFSSLVSLSTPAAVKFGYGLVMASALVLWFVGVSVFFTIPAVRDGFRRAGRWIARVTGLVFIGLGVKLATEKMRG